MLLAIALAAPLTAQVKLWLMASPSASVTRNQLIAFIFTFVLLLILGMMLLTEAYRMSEVNFVTPFEYTGLIWATLWGFWVFGEIPAWTTMFGAVLIVGAGLYVLFGAKSPDVHAELT